jgi:hypothetical protein
MFGRMQSGGLVEPPATRRLVRIAFAIQRTYGSALCVFAMNATMSRNSVDQ